MTKKYITLFLIILGFSTVLGFQIDSDYQKNCEIYTIYLVRHSEKDMSSNNGADPPLTQCGVQRSEHLSSFLSAVHLDAVYSTDYTRTEKTALPTARSKGIVIEEYAGHDLEAFSKLLSQRQQNALVVGHSNTTGVLAGMLVGEEIGEFDMDIYNRIYQVVIHKKRDRLHLLHTAFSCDD